VWAVYGGARKVSREVRVSMPIKRYAGNAELQPAYSSSTLPPRSGEYE